MAQQVHYYVDAQRSVAAEFFLQGYEQVSQCELVEVGEAPVHGQLDRWLVAVPFDSRLEFVRHAQHAAHVVRVQERAYAVELSSF